MTKRGIHTAPVRGATDDWLTPPWLLEKLGRFNLDPCACPDQTNQTAGVMICPPEDGLALDWSSIGRVWLNPPFGDKITPWLKKMVEHGNGIALVPARTEVERWFWPYVWEAADAVLFLRGRLWFLRPDGRRAGNAGHGSVLVAYGDANVLALAGCGVPGRLVLLKP